MMHGLYVLGVALVSILLWDAYILRRRARCGKTYDLYLFDKQATIPLRGVLVLAVIVGHVATRVPGMRELMSFIYFPTEAVAIFFFMSGYGMSKQWLTKGEVYRRGLIFRMFQKLVVPLLIVMCVGLVGWMHEGGGLLGIVGCYLHGDTVLCPHSWYVFALIIFAILFSISLHVRPRLASVVTLVALVSLMACIMAYGLRWGWWWWFSAPSFVVGVIFAHCEMRWRNILQGHYGQITLLLLSICLMCYLLMMVCMGVGRKSLFGMLFGAVLGPLIASIFYITPLAGKRGSILLFLGTISYELYLVHGLVRNVLVRYASQVPLPILVLLVIFLPVPVALVLRTISQLIFRVFRR